MWVRFPPGALVCNPVGRWLFTGDTAHHRSGNAQNIPAPNFFIFSGVLEWFAMRTKKTSPKSFLAVRLLMCWLKQKRERAQNTQALITT
jgi:hypothetical protein